MANWAWYLLIFFTVLLPSSVFSYIRDLHSPASCSRVQFILPIGFWKMIGNNKDRQNPVPVRVEKIAKSPAEMHLDIFEIVYFLRHVWKYAAEKLSLQDLLNVPHLVIFYFQYISWNTQIDFFWKICVKVSFEKITQNSIF